MSVYHLKFGGAGYVTVADDDVLDASATDSLFISFWGKLTSTSGTHTFLDKMKQYPDTADDVGWHIQYSGSRMYIRCDGSGGLGNNVISLQFGAIGVTATDWNHYAFLIDRNSAKTYVYINTVDRTGMTADYGDYSNDANLVIGARYREYDGTYLNYLDGHIEDVGIYKNSVTDSNVASVLANIYNSGVGRPANDDDFTDGWYTRMDDGRGLTMTGRKLSSGTYSALNGTISSLSDVEWSAGGVPFDDGDTDANYTENTYYINRTGKTIRFRLSGYNDSQLKEFKVLTPTVLGDR